MDLLEDLVDVRRVRFDPLLRLLLATLLGGSGGLLRGGLGGGGGFGGLRGRGLGSNGGLGGLRVSDEERGVLDVRRETYHVVWLGCGVKLTKSRESVVKSRWMRERERER